ncbi:MAG: hypothetical protein AAF438_09630, partial [Pseudomonadota bacterium]
LKALASAQMLKSRLGRIRGRATIQGNADIKEWVDTSLNHYEIQVFNSQLSQERGHKESKLAPGLA